MTRIFLTDTTLRDGNHTVSHRFSPQDAAAVAAGLQAAGIDAVEMGHGDGLNGSTINYGFAEHDDLSVIRAAAGALNKTKLCVLLIPGIGTVEILEQARQAGANMARVATHVTEADVAAQHIRAPRTWGCSRSVS
jgi:4-hydroxy 2-oxovalerate aldolase